MATHPGRFKSLALTSPQWAANDAVLLFGEIAAQDVGSMVPVLKIGDGVRRFSQLPNLGGGGGGGGGGASGADPSALVTLSPVAGVAATFMRSDAAPALSQAIAPTWTGQHTFFLTPGVPDESWTYAKIQNVTSARVLGRVTSGSGVIEELSGAQATSLLDIFTSTVRGVVPASGGGTANFLRADGVFAVPPGTATTVLPANPSATVALTAKNGSAATFMRSDAAPALDQAIAPTWTGVHTFSAPGVGSGSIILSSSTPTLGFYNPGAATDAKRWRFLAGTTSLQFAAIDDAVTAATNWLAVARTGMTIDSIALKGGAVTIDNYFRTTLSAIINGGTVYLTGSREAVTDLSDGYLRLNNVGHYASGIFTPGVLRSGTYLQADSGIQKGNDLSKVITWNVGGLPYGTVYVSGAVGTYHGVGVWDGTYGTMLMSNATNIGIFIYQEAWLIRRSAPGQAYIGYNVTFSDGSGTYFNATANNFNAVSSRASKRETGKPSRVAGMLAKLRPILYRMLKGDDAEQLGLIAEEVHAVCPQMSDGKTIAYDRLAILLLADWQERHARGALIDQQR